MNQCQVCLQYGQTVTLGDGEVCPACIREMLDDLRRNQSDMQRRIDAQEQSLQSAQDTIRRLAADRQALYRKITEWERRHA